MKVTSKFLAVSAAITLAGCGLPGTFYAEPFSREAISGSDFNAELAKAYQQRVHNSIETDANWILAGMYAKKGSAAQSGETVLPWDHTVYEEQPTFRNGVPADRASKYNLDSHRAELLSALDNGGRVNRPYACAQAQAHYDWLVDETFQDTPPIQTDEEDRIKADFMRFLNECKATPVKKVVKKAEPAAATEWVVYFGWDRYDLSAEAYSAVQTVVDSVKNIAGAALTVVGHTDTSGRDGYNKKLSVRRANAVVKALKQNNVNVVSGEGRGESDLAKSTSDGVREPLNRRAVITLKP